MVAISTVIAGIILALFATFCFNLGIVLQKKGLKEGLPELTLEEGVSGLGTSFIKYFKNKFWTLGFALGIIGWIPYVIAQGMVGIIVVQPIMGVGLVILVIFANIMLNEKISYYEIIAIGMMIIAPVLIAFSGISDVQIDLIGFLIPFIIFLIIIIVIIIICIMVGRKQPKPEWSGMFKIFVAGILGSLAAIFTNIFAQAYSDASINLISLFGWAEVLFGIFWFEYFHFWVFLGLYGLGFFFLTSMIFQNNGMQKGKAVILWPIQNSISLIIPVIAGFVVFGQAVANLLLFLIAVLLILIATIVLSKYQAEYDSD